MYLTAQANYHFNWPSLHVAEELLPVINDLGDLAWTRGWGDRPVTQIILDIQGERSVLIDTGDEALTPGVGTMNNAGHIAWKLFNGDACGFTSDIYLYDGTTSNLIFSDGLSNQSARGNEHDQIMWKNADFHCGVGGAWTSRIMSYSEGVVTVLPAVTTLPHGPTPQSPHLNNLGQAVWKGSGDSGIVYWDGENDPVLLIEGNARSRDINDRGDVAYGFRATPTSWRQMWVRRDGVDYQLTDDTNDDYDNIRPDLNEAGEVVWWWHPNGILNPSGIRYLRRIRTGEADFDGDIDGDDYKVMQDCLTGPFDTDRLCDCRFLDIDHTRTIDLADYALFQNAYTGP